MSEPNEHIAPGVGPTPHHVPGHDDHAGPSFQTYLNVFYALSVCTALSFVSNYFVAHMLNMHFASAAIIMAVAVLKATLVAGIFMHLKFDWGKLYCIILPVCVVTVMMVIILSIDATLVWHANPESAVPAIAR
jgi:caa(3)-type oxidase subunit IV